MSRSWFGILTATLTAAVALAAPPGSAALSLEPVGKFSNPTYVTSDPGDPDRVFVVQRNGTIQLTEDGSSIEFLNIDAIVESGGERGLLSMAFRPDFAATGLFYVFYTGTDDPATAAQNELGDLHIDEFTADGDAAIPGSRREVLTIEHRDFANHNGGQLQFGPDGLLYVSTGDGGGSNDPGANAQDLDSQLGKLLRIDPEPSGGEPYTVPADNPFEEGIDCVDGCAEIWSYGLRNPWRFSFDRVTGALAVGDVGQGAWEEVDYAPAPGAGSGENFGWDCREGLHAAASAGEPQCDGVPPGAFTDPVFEYQNLNPQPCAITGGYVVRDPALGDLQGRYLYADFCVGDLRSFDPADPFATDRSEGLNVASPASFGEDSSGRIYMASLTGPVYRIESDPVTPAPPDTRIDSGPSGLTNDPTPTFTFHSSEQGSSFECKLDDDGFQPCSSPHTTAHLDDGPHTFSVRATDAAQNTDPTPSSRGFTVDTTPPDTTIDSGPSGTTDDPTPTFSFHSSDPGSSFECRLGTGAWSACSSPRTYPSLSDGPHTFWVRATDEAANTDPSPASREFTVDTTPPTPPPPSNDFTFGKMKKNRKKGTAKLKVKVPGPGELELTKNKKVKGKQKSAEDEGTVKLPIKPRRKAKKRLKRKGKAKVRAKVTYTPDGGDPNARSKKVTLIKR